MMFKAEEVKDPLEVKVTTEMQYATYLIVFLFHLKCRAWAEPLKLL